MITWDLGSPVALSPPLPPGTPGWAALGADGRLCEVSPEQCSCPPQAALSDCRREHMEGHNPQLPRFPQAPPPLPSRDPDPTGPTKYPKLWPATRSLSSTGWSWMWTAKPWGRGRGQLARTASAGDPPGPWTQAERRKVSGRPFTHVLWEASQGGAPGRQGFSLQQEPLMAFQLIHTVCEGDTRPQAGHRARCTEGWLCRRVCSWRGTCTVGQVASLLGIPAGTGAGV